MDTSASSLPFTRFSSCRGVCKAILPSPHGCAPLHMLTFSFLPTFKCVTTYPLPFHILTFVDIDCPLLFPHFPCGLKLCYLVIIFIRK